MEKNIKIGIGVIILDGNKLLLGHRSKNRKDTGGIYEIDCWTLVESKSMMKLFGTVPKEK